jgi:predicted GNAT family N-acyltransferase
VSATNKCDHPDLPAFQIRKVRWPDDAPAIQAVRKAVFVVEQGVPEALEWDGLDGHCIQVLAIDSQGTAVGTARMLADGRIGRMAVLPDYRRQGIGTALLATLLAIAREQKLPDIFLYAQSHAADFYRHHGFQAVGDEFLEAGIPHLAMKLHLS